MSATIKVFQVGNKSYKHVMNAYHDAVELLGEEDEVLLVYGADAKVTSGNERMGDFYIEFLEGQPKWVFYDAAHQSRTILSPDRHAAEVEVSKRYLAERQKYSPSAQDNYNH